MSYGEIAQERKWNRSPSGSVPKTSARRPFRLGKGALAAVGVALAALAAAVFLMSGQTAPEAGETARPKSARRLLRRGGASAKKGASPREAVREAMKAMPRKKRVPRTGYVRPSMIFSVFSGKDRKMAEDLQKVLDADDFEGTLRAAEAAMGSENPELRRQAVEAMGWFGQDALPELTAAMADADEDVADSAEHAWELALSDIDAAGDRFAIAAAAMGTLSDEDKLSSISGLLSAAADEMIDGEEDDAKSDGNRLQVVQALVDIIEGAPENSAAQAREAYSDLTGEDWSDIDTAESWLVENFKVKQTEQMGGDNEGGDNEQENGGVDAGGVAVE